LHEEGAPYPKKITFICSAPSLAIEVLEVGSLDMQSIEVLDVLWRIVQLCTFVLDSPRKVTFTLPFAATVAQR